MKQIHAIVLGKVQGVWFRAWTRDTARELGLDGWVRNMADGNVEVAVQGNSEQLERFLERLHDGPPLARVTEVKTRWQNGEEPFSGFEVRR